MKVQLLGSARKDFYLRASLLLLVLAGFHYLSTPVLSATMGAPIHYKVLAAGSLLLPVSFCLGMFFPLGIRRAASRNLESFIPWFWGMNGAMSVCGAVLTTIACLHIGIAATFWFGIACYGVALVVLYRGSDFSVAGA